MEQDKKHTRARGGEEESLGWLAGVAEAVEF